jgi:deazaflavin-dependent oxidoreductase (nitroreductase family)
MERELVALGRAALLVTRGRITGEPRSVAVGYVDEPDGSVLVAANGPRSSWGLNLLADPSVHVEIGERRFEAEAEELGRADHGRAVRELILRYGTPSEGLGTGPSFRLRPVEPTPAAPAAAIDADAPGTPDTADAPHLPDPVAVRSAQG